MGTTTRAAPLTAAVLLVVAVVLGALPPAAAIAPGALPATGTPTEDARSARRAAEQAEATVSQLTARVDEQLAARDRAMADLASAVQGSIRSEQVADSAAQRAAASQGRHARTVRALYRAGGQLGLYASVLEAGSVAEALDRTAMARRVLSWTSSNAKDRSSAPMGTRSEPSHSPASAANAATRPTRSASSARSIRRRPHRTTGQLRRGIAKP